MDNVHQRTGGDKQVVRSVPIEEWALDNLLLNDPKLASEWHPKNGDLTADTVTIVSGKEFGKMS